MNVLTPLTPDRCCLHIVDVQVNLMKAINGAEGVTDTVLFLLKAAKVLKIPIIANTQYRKGLGFYVPELEAMMNGIPRPDKIEFNALENPETRALVDALPEQTSLYILAGVETHICIYQTALGVLRRGFTPWIVADGVSSRRKEDHEYGLRRLEKLGAIVGTAEMLVYELLGRAGSSEFREMLPFILAQKR